MKQRISDWKRRHVEVAESKEARQRRVRNEMKEVYRNGTEMQQRAVELAEQGFGVEDVVAHTGTPRVDAIKLVIGEA